MMGYFEIFGLLVGLSFPIMKLIGPELNIDNLLKIARYLGVLPTIDGKLILQTQSDGKIRGEKILQAPTS